MSPTKPEINNPIALIKLKYYVRLTHKYAHTHTCPAFQCMCNIECIDASHTQTHIHTMRYSNEKWLCVRVARIATWKICVTLETMEHNTIISRSPPCSSGGPFERSQLQITNVLVAGAERTTTDTYYARQSNNIACKLVASIASDLFRFDWAHQMCE